MAAVIIQAAWRGHRTRLKLKKEVDESKRNSAATVIQVKWFAARKNTFQGPTCWIHLITLKGVVFGVAWCWIRFELVQTSLIMLVVFEQLL